MKRRLLNLARWSAPLLVAAVAGLWVRSYSTSDLAAYEPAKEAYSIWSERGEVCFRQVRDTFGTLEPWRHEALAVDEWNRYVPPQSRRRWPGGFWWETGKAPGRGQPYFALVVPYWALTVLSAAPMAWVVARYFWRRRRNRAGFCRECGYDLRATPGRCPECGTDRAEG